MATESSRDKGTSAALLPSHPLRDETPDSEAVPWDVYVHGRLMGLEAVLPPQARILEIGCGLGLNTLRMASVLPEADIVGLEWAEDLVESASVYKTLSDASRVSYRLGSLKEQDGLFDYIFLSRRLDTLSEVERQPFLAAAAEHLAPQGLLYMPYISLPHGIMKLTANRWQRALGGEKEAAARLYNRIQIQKAERIAAALGEEKRLAHALLEVARRYPKELADLREALESSVAPAEALELLQNKKGRLLYGEALQKALQQMKDIPFSKEAAAGLLTRYGLDCGLLEISSMQEDQKPAVAQEKLYGFFLSEAADLAAACGLKFVTVTKGYANRHRLQRDPKVQDIARRLKEDAAAYHQVLDTLAGESRQGLLFVRAGRKVPQAKRAAALQGMRFMLKPAVLCTDGALMTASAKSLSFQYGATRLSLSFRTDDLKALVAGLMTGEGFESFADLYERCRSLETAPSFEAASVLEGPFYDHLTTLFLSGMVLLWEGSAPALPKPLGTKQSEWTKAVPRRPFSPAFVRFQAKYFPWKGIFLPQGAVYVEETPLERIILAMATGHHEAAAIGEAMKHFVRNTLKQEMEGEALEGVYQYLCLRLLHQGALMEAPEDLLERTRAAVLGDSDSPAAGGS